MKERGRSSNRGGGLRLRPPRGRVLVGRRAVMEALRARPGGIETLYFDPGAGRRAPSFMEVLAAAEAAGVRTRPAAAADLNAMSGAVPHQGVVAVLTAADPVSLDAFLKTCLPDHPQILVLADSVLDPHNLGAIIRAAECFGAGAVVWSRNRGCQLSAAARKASAGASEVTTCIAVSNLAEGLTKIKAANFWAVAADCAPEAEDASLFRFPPRTALVLGSEGEGLRPLTLKRCDYRIRIPMSGRIASLNVSQAAAVLLANYRSQFKQ